MDALYLLACTALILFAATVFLIILHRKQPTGLPPGPMGLPILGYIPFLRSDLHLQFTHLARKYGPICSLRLGNKLYVVVSSPALVQQVVRDHDAVFANRDPPVAAMVATGGKDIAFSNGSYWRDIRKLFVREMLSNNNLQASYSLRREEVRKAVRVVDGKTGRGEVVEIGELVFKTEVNVAMSLVWGGDMDTARMEKLGGEFRQMMKKLVDLLGKPNVSDFFPSLAWIDLQGIEREMRAVLPGIENILDSVIEERMEKMSGGESSATEKDFIGILLKLTKEKNSVGGEDTSPFGVNQIKAILKDIIVGGTDTTATIVEWVMTELLHRPEVMQRVQQELTEVVGLDNLVEESDLPKLHYLDTVVKETFRLHPPLPLLVPRSPTQSCNVGGYTVPKGSLVFLNMWSIHMDPLVWENPSEFKPERFLNDDSGNFDYAGNSVEYLPFGSGRRVCPGLPLAERMLMYLVASLVHLFDWELPEGEKFDLSEKFGLVMRKTVPLIAVARRRSPSPDLYA